MTEIAKEKFGPEALLRAVRNDAFSFNPQPQARLADLRPSSPAAAG